MNTATLVRRASDRMPARAVIPNDDRSPATRNATAGQRRRTLNVALFLMLVTAALVPIAAQHLPKYAAFFPSYQTAVILSYLVTGYLMMGLHQATRIRSLLHLSAGSFYTAGILLMQLLAFPGAFTDKGTLIGGPQTMIWLWFFWHAGPALGILFFAYGEMRNPGATSISRRMDLFQTFAVTAMALFATGLLVTTFHDWLPVLDQNGDFGGINSSGLAPGLQVLLLIALCALWLVSGFKKVLHLWLAMGLVALLCDNAITMLGTTRLSVGWYAGRSGALLSALIVPLLYLQEIKLSYVRAVGKVDELTEENAGLSKQVDRSRHDTLTGLPGRALFMDRAQAMLKRIAPTDLGFVTLFIDLDGFKAVNDQHGHERGDEVLKRVAEILQAELRDGDVATRLGGDEFAVCMEAPADMAQIVASKVAERIVDKIHAIGMELGASVGISANRENIDLALNEADEAMYSAKKSGKNRSSFFRAPPKLVVAA